MKPEAVLFIASHPHAFSPWIEAAESAGYKPDELIIQTPDDLDQGKIRIADYAVLFVWLPQTNGLKHQVLQQLDSLLHPDALLLATAHDVMTTEMSSWIPQSSGRLVGFSPFGITRQSQLVCLSSALQTEPRTCQKAETFFRDLQLQSAWITDTPGMILPRIYAMLANEAAFTLQEGVASAADIDTAMRLGTNYPMGPLEWADTVGLDTVLRVLTYLWETYRDARYRPCLLLTQKVKAGHMGKSTGQGFYQYSDASAPYISESPHAKQMEPLS